VSIFPLPEDIDEQILGTVGIAPLFVGIAIVLATPSPFQSHVDVEYTSIASNKSKVIIDSLGVAG